MARIPMQDPRFLYDRPSYPPQEQSVPGTEGDMHPTADHGEKTYRGTGQLEGMKALITGGDSGIGRAVALAYAREGADVCFTYLCEDKDAEETERLIREAGRTALALRMDQKSKDECEDALRRCIEGLGGLDILVNNAAFQMTYGSFGEIPSEEFAKTFETNVAGVFYFSQAALAHLPAGGSIINTTSIQAFKPSVHLAPYSATKAAIANLTLSLAEEAIANGVRVNGIAPGPVWTPLIPSTFPPDKVEGFGANTLLERPAQPAELAPLYVFLASPAASFITGEIYGVTGGEKQL